MSYQLNDPRSRTPLRPAWFGIEGSDPAAGDPQRFRASGCVRLRRCSELQASVAAALVLHRRRDDSVHRPMGSLVKKRRKRMRKKKHRKMLRRTRYQRRNR